MKKHKHNPNSIASAAANITAVLILIGLAIWLAPIVQAIIAQVQAVLDF